MMQFDENEVRGIMRTIISPTDRETCFLAIYNRTAANVFSVSKLNGRQHFQAITMLARNLFELSVDIVLIDKIPASIEKMIAYVDAEKLRCARKIILFKKKHPGSKVEDSIYQAYVASQGARIDADKNRLWPGLKRPNPEGWADMNLKDRSVLAGLHYEEIYEVEQPRMSWQVHAGLTGVVNLKAESFDHMAGVAIGNCIQSYETILSTMIDEFQIGKADAKIKNKLEVSKLLPWEDDPLKARQFYLEAIS